MGLNTDIEEISTMWRGAPWRVRVLLGLSIFLSASSIASLSETVFKWKGFVLDALTFYRTYIGTPVGIWLTKQLTHAPAPDFFDNAVIYTLFFSCLIRVAGFRTRSTAARVIDVTTLAASYLAMIYLLLNPSSKMSSSVSNGNAVWINYLLFLLFIYLFTKGAERILAISYMLSPVLVVGVLGAISVGLSR
jgi:hypothetical protein